MTAGRRITVGVYLIALSVFPILSQWQIARTGGCCAAIVGFGMVIFAREETS